MARRYDSRTTIFSPEGRLYQVEYAVENISKAGLIAGVLSKDGVVLVAEKKISSKVARRPRPSQLSHQPALAAARPRQRARPPLCTGGGTASAQMRRRADGVVSTARRMRAPRCKAV